MKNDIDEGRDRHPARHFSSRHAPHSVGDDHQVDGLAKIGREVFVRDIGEHCRGVASSSGDEVVVFVLVPHLACVRERCNVDVHARGDRSRDIPLHVW